MPEESAVIDSPHNPDAELVGGATPAVSAMWDKFANGVQNWEKEQAAAGKISEADKTPENEKEKPELDKPEPAKEAVKVEPTKPAENAKVEPAKVDAAKPADAVADPLTLELPRSASVKANENFSKVKEVAKTERTRAEKAEKALKDAQVQIEGLKKNGNAPADYEQIKKEREELDNIVRVSAVERHPKFKAYFDGKVASATALAVDIAGADNKVAVEAALKMHDGPAKDAAIDEILSVLPQYKAVQLGAALAQFPAIQRERDSELAKARESYDKLETERTGQTAAQTKAREEATTKYIAEAEAAAAEFDGFKEIEGDAEHNTQVASRKQFIRDLATNKVSPEIAKMVPVMVGEYLHLKNSVMPKLAAQLEAFQKQLKELQGATPNLVPKPPKNDNGNSGDQPVGFVQDFMSRMRGDKA